MSVKREMKLRIEIVEKPSTHGHLREVSVLEGNEVKESSTAPNNSILHVHVHVREVSDYEGKTEI